MWKNRSRQFLFRVANTEKLRKVIQQPKVKNKDHNTPSPLLRSIKTLDIYSRRYLELLNDNLDECCVKCEAERFTQDEAPYHETRQVIEWFDNWELEYLRGYPGF